MQYKVVYEVDVSKFEESVSEALDGGWQLHGGLLVTDTSLGVMRLFQVLIKQ